MFMIKNDSIYLKTAIKAWLCYCLVYSFMIFQFCWGNHDWRYLKEGVSISDGFFEARFNQHLFSVLFFDGQILPVIAYLFSFAGLGVFSVLSAEYLKIPKEEGKWLFFALFVGLNPHVFALFSYVYIMMPFIFWGIVGVLSLFLLEQPERLLRLFCSVICSLLILGSYPPIVSLVYTMFIGRQLLLFLAGEKGKKDIFYNGLVLGAVWGVSFIFYKFVMISYVIGERFNAGMYNIKTVGADLLVQRFFLESLRSVSQLWDRYPFLDKGYWQVLFVLVLAAVFVTLRRAKDKIFAAIMLFFIFVASRTVFIIAENANFAQFRLTYWGKLGIYVFALSVLLREENKGIKNFVFAAGVLALCLFVRADFEIQKVWNLGFKAERMLHQRLVERIVQNPSFEMEKKYAFLNFGVIPFKWNFYMGKHKSEGHELLSALVLPADLGETLFWEEKDNPVMVKFGVWNNHLWRVNHKSIFYPLSISFSIDDALLGEFRYWMYHRSGTWPNEASVFVRDKYIFVVLDETVFNRSKELVVLKIRDLLYSKPF